LTIPELARGHRSDLETAKDDERRKEGGLVRARGRRRPSELCESAALGRDLCERLAEGVHDLCDVGRALDDLRAREGGRGGREGQLEGTRAAQDEEGGRADSR